MFQDPKSSRSTSGPAAWLRSLAVCCLLVVASCETPAPPAADAATTITDDADAVPAGDGADTGSTDAAIEAGSDAIDAGPDATDAGPSVIDASDTGDADASDSTDAGLDSTDAADASDTGTDASDADTDASTDASDVQGGCTGAADCDDGVPCTIDACVSGTCQHVTLPGCGGTVPACSTGADCATGVCDPTSHACVPCVQAADCGGGAWQCQDHACVPAVACSKDKECKAFGQLCGPSGVCVECSLDVDCSAGHVCSGHACVPSQPCKSTKECDGVCDTQAGQCVACNKSSDCEAGQFCSGHACLPVLCKASACLGTTFLGCQADGSGYGVTDCKDGNPCTEDTCETGQGCVAVPNSATCTDGNACTEGDGCSGGACVAGNASVCDDGNPCTDDACDGGTGCVHLATAATCSDGDACTQGDVCSQGACAAGKALACDDGNPCTDDGCAPASGCTNLANAASCSDGDVCTEGDACSGGKCAPGVAISCDDGNPCTDDACAPGSGCSHAANAATCSDGSACTTGDHCTGGQCAAGPAVDCDDGNPCTADSCDKGQGCTALPNSATCSDGDACTGGDGCVGGKCVPGKAITCDDANPCTSDNCDKAKGCGTVSVAGACSDDNACTAGDGCVDGKCLGGKAIDCDDGNPCTDDACDKAKGCVHADNAAPCSDGSKCTTGDKCGGGKCNPGAALLCDDGNPCTADDCEPVQGCTTATTTAPCDDGNACTTGDKCGGGKCLGGVAMVCSDQNACTDDSCDPGKGCVAVANSAPCDDGNACTTGDKCAGGKCAAGTALVCSDSNACTNDSCDPGKGCVFVNTTATCDDGNGCTTNDVCVGGVCKGSGGPNCDDQNPCTSDGCSGGSCTFTYNTQPCDDGSACTTGDACQGGKCVGGAAPDCNDGNPCTDDGCNKIVGCQHIQNSAACSDGDACTVGDGCSGGKCASGTAKVCDDGNPCTDDACDKATGCKVTANTAPCNDNNACTPVDACSGGVCKGAGSKDCNDDNGCTSDSCDAIKGCVNAANTATCDDGNGCTVGDACAGGSCKPGAAKDCSDSNPCTDDACDPVSGCKSSNNTATCNDGNACTSLDVCSGGKCAGSGGPNCDDGNGCTTDGCANGTCTHTGAPESTACGDGTACIATECHDGACVKDAAKVWTKSYGTSGNEVVAFYSAAGTQHLLGGPTSSTLVNWLMATDWSGKQLWQINPCQYTFYGMTGLPDGSSIVACTYDLIKYDAAGKKVWGQALQGYKFARLVPLKDGGFLGLGQGDISVARYDSKGNQLWSKTIYINGMQPLKAAIELADGSFAIAAAYNNGSNYEDGARFFMDANGNVALPTGSMATFGQQYTEVVSGMVTYGDGFVVVGSTGVANKGAQGWLARLDKSGKAVWQFSYGNLGEDLFTQAVVTADGTIVATGYLKSDNGQEQFGVLVAVDSNGNKLWDRVYPIGNAWYTSTTPQGLSPVPDGFVIGGMTRNKTTNNDGFLMHTDAWGHETCQAAGTCGTKNPDACDDQNACTVDSCNADGSCKHAATVADGTSCGAGGATCSSGTCGAPLGCDHTFKGPGFSLKDNNAFGNPDSNTLFVTDVGAALQIFVTVDVANSDLANGVKMTLVDPAGQSYQLIKPGSGASSPEYIATFPAPTATLSGDLGFWKSKNAKGNWMLQANDTTYLNNGSDGQVYGWSVTVRTTCP